MSYVPLSTPLRRYAPPLAPGQWSCEAGGGVYLHVADLAALKTPIADCDDAVTILWDAEHRRLAIRPPRAQELDSARRLAPASGSRRRLAFSRSTWRLLGYSAPPRGRHRAVVDAFTLVLRLPVPTGAHQEPH